MLALLRSGSGRWPVGREGGAAEHYAAIDELAKWCIMKTTDMDLRAAGRAWGLFRLGLITKETPPEESGRLRIVK